MQKHNGKATGACAVPAKTTANGAERKKLGHGNSPDQLAPTLGGNSGSGQERRYIIQRPLVGSYILQWILCDTQKGGDFRGTAALHIPPLDPDIVEWHCQYNRKANAWSFGTLRYIKLGGKRLGEKDSRASIDNVLAEAVKATIVEQLNESCSPDKLA